MRNLYIIAVVLIVVLIIKRILSSSKVKGALGEKKVNKRLKRVTKDGKLFKNYMLLDSNGMSHQIDSILVDKRGVFVVETKNYKGKIYGNDNKDYWTQKCHARKNNFYSPVLQNEGHIKSLREILPKNIKMKNIVVFVGKSNLRKVRSKYTVKLSDLTKTIKKNRKCLSKKEIREVIEILEDNRSDISLKEHVENIQKLKEREMVKA